MDIHDNYLNGKRDSINNRMREIEDLIQRYQTAVSELQKEYVYLQGSLAIVGELCDLEKGGLDEEHTNQS